MKKIYSILLAVFITAVVFAQAPQKMSYQAVIRSSNNQLVTSHAVGMKISILQGSATGTAVYVETQTPNTNANGLVSIEIGGEAGFDAINWASGPYFIKTETDPTGGTNYSISGTSQLLAVPYALYAKTAENSSGGNYNNLTGKPAIADSINKYSVLLTGIQTVGGFKTYSNDVVINGLTIGRGNGSIVSNTVNGNGALNLNTSGFFNTANGNGALHANTTGNSNTAIGYVSLNSNTTGSKNTAIGPAALYKNTTGFENTGNGYSSLYNNTTGYSNTAIGSNSLTVNTTGFHNTASGAYALYSNTTGFDNTANGYNALYNNITGRSNVAVGYDALYYNMSGSWNTAIGDSALFSNFTENKNTGIGHKALFSSSGWDNTATGYQSMSSNLGGFDNVANGVDALTSNTSGNGNTAVGKNALSTNITGSNNTALGLNANVSSNNLSNATAIGYGASVNASNKVRIGNSSVTVIEGQVAFTYPSDKRLKKNIEDLSNGLGFILKLRPVEYQMKQGDDKINYGFIAQEVEALIGTNNSMLTIGADTARTLGLRYTDFIAPLVKAIQEQQNEITNYAKANNALKNEVLELKNQMEEISKRLDALIKK